MLTGRVVQFDEGRGYGFITPDGGGEDVFVHVNMLGTDRWALAPGVPVEFDAVDSERGPKALTVRVIGNGTAAITPSERTVPPSADDGCDIVSARAFRAEITELLLSSVPDLTAAQVVTLRQAIQALAHRHGWVEDDT